jgi:hypothetical protein
VALSNAEKQAAWRERREAKIRDLEAEVAQLRNQIELFRDVQHADQRLWDRLAQAIGYGEIDDLANLTDEITRQLRNQDQSAPT